VHSFTLASKLSVELRKLVELTQIVRIIHVNFIFAKSEVLLVKS
jgi:hypothetical protein